jgi:hypothetical protein
VDVFRPTWDFLLTSNKMCVCSHDQSDNCLMTEHRPGYERNFYNVGILSRSVLYRYSSRQSEEKHEKLQLKQSRNRPIIDSSTLQIFSWRWGYLTILSVVWLYSIEWYDDRWMINCKGFDRVQSRTEHRDSEVPFRFSARRPATLRFFVIFLTPCRHLLRS